MTFTEKFNQGILSKKLFLESKETQEFIKWLLPYISGEEKLKSISEDYSFNSLQIAADKYEWKNDKGYKASYKIFQDFKKELDNAKNSSEALQTCVKIVKWGGINNYDRLSAIGDVLFFLNHMQQKLSSDEICIYDLNPNYINSGFTKVYAAYIDGFTMYDGRVGAALCSLIGYYLQEHNAKEIPAELNFGWAWGMGKVDTRKNRNPNRKEFEHIAFSEINERSRELHFISNIKANWLLYYIAEQIELLKIVCLHEKAFALQSALFMLGEEVPPKNKKKK
jgi:hypothetical protein